MLTILSRISFLFFFFNDTATTEIYTLSLHDALPISLGRRGGRLRPRRLLRRAASGGRILSPAQRAGARARARDSALLALAVGRRGAVQAAHGAGRGGKA